MAVEKKTPEAFIHSMHATFTHEHGGERGENN